MENGRIMNAIQTRLKAESIAAAQDVNTGTNFFIMF